MKTLTGAARATAATDAAAATSDPFHGDLRKGSYLRRRAAYQMQAEDTAPAQPAGPPPAGRQTR
ncbi:MAG: hypothetical protein QNJ91_16775 [Gammaproteobacteria bacterium]|nr:hypothetical protein [Gammaproteobacteria bacterium]